MPLNEKSSGGLFGKVRQKVMSAANIEDEKFRNTADVTNSLKNMVAKVLKSTFGGQLSDGERAYLNEVYGAAEGQSVAERRIAMSNIKRMFENRVAEKEQKYNELGGVGGKATITVPKLNGGVGGSGLTPEQRRARIIELRSRQ